MTVKSLSWDREHRVHPFRNPVLLEVQDVSDIFLLPLQRETLSQRSELWALDPLVVPEAPGSLSPQTHRKKTPAAHRTQDQPSHTSEHWASDLCVCKSVMNPVLHFQCRTTRRLSLCCLCEIWRISSSSWPAPLRRPCGNLFRRSNRTPPTPPES